MRALLCVFLFASAASADVLYFKTERSEPSKKTTPVFESWKRAGHAVEIIDGDKQPELAKKHKVTVYPTAIITGPPECRFEGREELPKALEHMSAGVAATVRTKTSGAVYVASGFAVSTDHIVTANHAVRFDGTLTVNGKPATVVARDERHDIAILHAPKHGAAVIAISEASIKRRGFVMFGDFKQRRVSARVRHAAVQEKGADRGSSFEVSAPWQSGFSGGPGISAMTGAIVGMCLGSDLRSRGHALHIPKFRKWIRKSIPSNVAPAPQAEKGS